MNEALLMALIKILLKQFPGLAPAVILAELENFAEGAAKAFVEWWNSYNKDDPWPVPPDWPAQPPGDGTGV